MTPFYLEVDMRNRVEDCPTCRVFENSISAGPISGFGTTFLLVVGAFFAGVMFSTAAKSGSARGISWVEDKARG